MFNPLAQPERAVHRSTDLPAKRLCLTAVNVDAMDRGYRTPQGSPILVAVDPQRDCRGRHERVFSHNN